MSKKLNCIVCGKEYETCNCSKDLKTYKVITDSVNCYQIYLIVSDFVNGVITREEAKKMLSKCDIKDYKKFKKPIVLSINKILKESVVKKINNKAKDKGAQDLTVAESE